MTAFRNAVTKITVKGYKSIRELELPLDRLNLMIGANGAGKSNLISLFRFLNDVVGGRMQNHVRQSGGADSILYFGSRTTRCLEIEIEFGPNKYHLKLAPDALDTLYFEKEVCSFHKYGFPAPYEFSVLSSDTRESGLAEEAALPGKPIAATTLQSIQSWKLYHFHDTSDTAPLKKSGAIDDNQRLRPDGSNLAAYLYLLQQVYPHDFSNITNTVKLIAPFFQGFTLRESPLSPGKIQLEWRHNSSDNYFGPNSLSDGTLRFICLATLLLQPSLNLPTTILLDEPELGLHPAAIQALAALLKSVSSRTQVLVSTQSVTLINQMSPESLIIVDRDDEQSVFRRLKQGEVGSWLDGYGLGEIWEKNVLGGRP